MRSSSSSDFLRSLGVQNRTTRTAFTADGQFKTLTASNNDTSNRQTKYDYGTWVRKVDSSWRSSIVSVSKFLHHSQRDPLSFWASPLGL